MRNEQWPAGFKPESHREREDHPRETAYREEIEAFFSRLYGIRTVLMPSGRAAVHAILEFAGLGRGDTVFAPRWSSSCIWDTIGRIANPTVSLTPAPRAVLAVHKWGYVHHFRMPQPGLIVEDSVDSVITDAQGILPLGSQFEVLSLPKILASTSGGIVLTKSGDFSAFVAEQRKSRRALGVHQSRLKFRRALGTLGDFESPDWLEPLNRHVDFAGLEDICARLSNFDANASVILRRIESVQHHLGKEAIEVPLHRFPCVFPAPIEHYQAEEPALYLERRFNSARCLDGDHYVVCRLLPLHFGIDDHSFEALLRGLHRR